MTADGGERSLGAPRFDVVLRGYDRRQVDEHVARLQRVVARLRADLDAARSQPLPIVRPGRPGFGGSPPAVPRESPDVVGNFSDRMQGILQAAEEEAEEIRVAARKEARAETEAARAELGELVRQRDAVLGELTRLRGQLEGLLSAPTARFAATPPSSRPGTGQLAPSGHSGPGHPPSGHSGPGHPPSGHSGPGHPPSGQAGGPPAPGAERPRPSPRPKTRPSAAAEAAQTAALRMPEPQAGDLFRSSARPGEHTTTKVPLPSQVRPGDLAHPGGAPSHSHGHPEERDDGRRPGSDAPGKPRSGGAGSGEKSVGEDSAGKAASAVDESAKVSTGQSRSEAEVDETMVVNVVRPSSGAQNSPSAPVASAQHARPNHPEPATGERAGEGSARAAAAGTGRGSEK